MGNFVSLVLRVVAVLSAVGIEAPAFSRTPPEALPAFVDGVVREAMVSDHVAGVGVAIVVDGRIALLRGYGVARPAVPVDPARTLFRIGSITKTFTWIAVMRAVERGELSLDTDINRYLPERLRVPAQGFRPITLRHLMSHSAGFADSELGHLIVDRPDQLVPFERYLVRHRPPRVREPGEKASYSNYGTALAGYIVARRAGLTYPALIERDVASPLGTARLTMREPYPARAGLPRPVAPALAADFARGFAWNGTRFDSQPTELLANSSPSGSGSMSALAAARYMRLLLGDGTIDGRQVYGPLAEHAFRTPILRTALGTNGWAHGFVMSLLPDGSVGYGHGGSTVDAQSNLVVIPARRLGIFIATNSASGYAMARRLPGLIVDWLDGSRTAAIPRAGDPALVRRADDYAGSYRSTRRPYRGLEAFVDALDGPASIAVTSDGRLVTKVGALTRAWVPAGSAGEFVAVDGPDRLRFDLDADGRARGVPFITGTAYLERSSRVFDRATFDRLGAITIALALATLLAAAVRRENRRGGAAIALIAAAALWLAAGAAFAVWLPQASSPRLMYDFPGALLPATSLLALAAAVASVAALLSQPVLWTSSRAVTARLLHLLIAGVFTAFAALLFVWHALSPFA